MASPHTPMDHDGVEDQNDYTMEEQSDGNEEGDAENSTMVGEDGTSKKANPAQKTYQIDEHTDYSVFSNPHGLGLMRQRLFDLEERLELSPSDFEQYFPFVDNVWRRNRTGEPHKDSTTTTETYWCRLRQTAGQKPHTPKPPQEGKQQRKKRTRENKTCPMAIKVIYTDAPVRKCTVVRAVAPDIRHSHDLDYMDQTKRNSGVMDIARREAIKGFLPGSVFWKMQDEPEKMDEAGGKFMKVSDVRNVQYAWRQDNLEVDLKAHAGYHQTRSGPRQKPSSPQQLQNVIAHIPALPAAVHPTVHAVVQPAPIAPPPPPPPPPDAARISLGTLQYPEHARAFLQPYLPSASATTSQTRPHVTLTWATSLDSRIALMPGMQTVISGPETKAMTHYLRSRHDAIVIGVRTAISDDPGLNCRLMGAGGHGGVNWEQQPRPIIIDPHARLIIHPEMRILKMTSEGRAKGPWVIVGPNAKLHPVAVSTLKAHGGEYLMINDIHPQRGLGWEGIFHVLFREGIRSIMIEGGGVVLSELLRPLYTNLIDSVILTIAPTFFGRAGVEVAPEPTFDEQRRPIATRLQNVRWQPMGEQDVVMCAHMRPEGGPANSILPGIQEFSQMPPGEEPRANGAAPSVAVGAKPAIRR